MPGTGIGISLVLIAIGAILTWAVTLTSSAIAIPTVGIILMCVGGIGLLISLLGMMSWFSLGRTHTDRVEHVDRIEDERYHYR